MKRHITNVAFNKTAKTVTFSGFTSIAIERILAVINVTRNVILYNPVDPLRGGTVATNVLTLTFNTDTGDFNNADKLMVVYDLPDQLNRHVAASGTTSGLLVANPTLTISGWTPVEVEITNVNGAGILYISTNGTDPTASPASYTALLPATPSSVILPVVGPSVDVRLFGNSQSISYAVVVRGTT